MSDDFRWEARFTAPTVGFPQWSAAAPEQLYYLSDEGGSLQAWVLDTGTGRRARLTDQPIGVESLAVLPDGSGVAWWRDDTGDENGTWEVSLADGRRRALLPGAPPLPDGWAQGLSLRRGVTAFALADDERYRVYAAVDDAPPWLLHESTAPAGLGRVWESAAVGGLSADGRLLCIWHTEGGDYLHVALRILRVDDGSTIGELRDAGLTLVVADWSPVAGDQRLAVVHERDGVERPAVCDARTGVRRDYPLDLPGPVDVAGWWPDGSALLLLADDGGRRRVLRLDVESGAATLVHDPKGWVDAAAVRPDGSVWLREESATRAARVRDVHGTEVLSLGGARPPVGRPHRSLAVPTAAGTMHLLVTEPAGDRPHPAVVLVHGGPEWAYPDDLDPYEQALVDHGFAVVKPNYRGSTGSTVAWRTALHDGNIGFPEVEDVVTALDHVTGLGIVDPARVAVEGWSWGGYVSVLAAGLHPYRFAAVVGGVPVCDLVMTHDECSPPQQAYDRAIMGGDPTDRPERYAERSPVTYVDRVRAPMLLLAGEHDSACPVRQVRHYAELLRTRGGTVELYVHDAGHHANSVEEQLRQVRTRLAFLQRWVPTDVTARGE
jgi:dipeptidyl aminopeptidase/acylaminoacyl peptidase